MKESDSMKSEIYIDKKSLRNTINTYLSNLLGQKIDVSIDLIEKYSGYRGFKERDIEISYEVKRRINDFEAVITSTLNSLDIKNILQAIIPEYEIETINIDIGYHGYERIEEIDGLTIELKENVLSLGKK